jgi:hypothetical protein
VQVVLQTLRLGLEYLDTFFDGAHGHGSSSKGGTRLYKGYGEVINTVIIVRALG